MNAEANNLTSGTAGGNISLHNVTRALLIVVPFFGLAGVGIGYTDFNIHQRMFVDALGCGCGPSPNTNDLTMCVGFTSMGLTLAAWWLAASGLPWKARLALSSFELLVFGSVFLRTFFWHNFWL